MRVRFPRIAFVFACVVSLALPLAAQSTNGTINGRVLDPSNKVLGGADILAINDATGVQYSGKTNEDGIYVVPNLPPGGYRLQVSKVGFKTLIKPDIVLNIQDALSINFTLPVGAVFETVTVEGGASMINTTDASVSTVVDQTYITNLPLNGRSFQDLILLTPGIVTQTPQNSSNSAIGQTGEFSVNGQRPESNYYTVDGVSANVGASPGLGMTFGAGASGSVPTATALGTTQALVSVDDLQEFRVQTSTYSAEYGRNPGGQFAFETKSGTNQWHGTAYDYLRNGFFDAQDWFNDYFGLKEPALKQNDFGGTLGGPVKIPGLYSGNDRTFFFISYEGLRLAQPTAASVNYVPDPCMRGLGACPSGRNPAPAALQQALNAFPLPSANGVDDVPNGIAQFIGTWSNRSSLDSTSVRFDHVVNDRLRLFFRFSNTTSNSNTRATYAVFGTPSMDGSALANSRNYTGGASSVLTSHLSNELRFNYISNEVPLSTVIDSAGGSTPVNLAQLSGVDPGSYAQVVLAYGPYYVALAQALDSGVQRQWNLVDTVSLSLGRQQFKFGADYRRLAPLATPASPSVSYFYLAEASVETNSAYTQVGARAPAHPLYTNFSAFAQDEWRVSQRLTFAFGLRWEVNPSPGVTQGLMPYTIQGTGPSNYALAPQGTRLWQTTWYNFAPRLGVAYMVHNVPGHEIVVRGGGGVFFDTGQQLGSQSFLGPGFSVTGPFQPGGSFPESVTVPIIVNPPVGPQGILYGYPSHLQLPYTLQWNASIEQELGKSQAWSASYVGSHAARLLERNLILALNNPNTSEVSLTNNGLSADYDAVQIQFRRRLSRGLTTLASYTWSHCIDYGSQNYFLGYQRGSCDFDVRHNLSGAFSYDLPNAGKNSLSRVLLNQWGIDDRFSSRTGFPVTLDGNANIDPVTGQISHAGLDLVSGQPVYIYGSQCAAVYDNSLGCPGGRAINPNAFTDKLSSPFGDAPRNFVRGFGAWQMDLAIRRDFPIHERLRMQFRAEAFNIFNHPNFGTINQNYCSAGAGTACNFGQATGTLANSLGILSPLYQMGGPRSMQFALKLVF